MCLFLCRSLCLLVAPPAWACVPCLVVVARAFLLSMGVCVCFFVGRCVWWSWVFRAIACFITMLLFRTQYVIIVGGSFVWPRGCPPRGRSLWGFLWRLALLSLVSFVPFLRVRSLAAFRLRRFSRPARRSLRPGPFAWLALAALLVFRSVPALRSACSLFRRPFRPAVGVSCGFFLFCSRGCSVCLRGVAVRFACFCCGFAWLSCARPGLLFCRGSAVRRRCRLWRRGWPRRRRGFGGGGSRVGGFGFACRLVTWAFRRRCAVGAAGLVGGGRCGLSLLWFVGDGRPGASGQRSVLCRSVRLLCAPVSVELITASPGCFSPLPPSGRGFFLCALLHKTTASDVSRQASLDIAR